ELLTPSDLTTRAIDARNKEMMNKAPGAGQNGNGPLDQSQQQQQQQQQTDVNAPAIAQNNPNIAQAIESPQNQRLNNGQINSTDRELPHNSSSPASNPANNSPRARNLSRTPVRRTQSPCQAAPMRTPTPEPPILAARTAPRRTSSIRPCAVPSPARPTPAKS